jgi:hypothetical protein
MLNGFLYYTLIIQQLQGNTSTAGPSRHPGQPGKASRTRHGNKPPHAGTLQQPMFIRGHTDARTEPRPIGLCKHPQTRTVHEEVTPT